MPSGKEKSLIIKFKPSGDDKLIKAINKLASSQKRLKKSTDQASKANKKYKFRVDANTKAVGRQNAVMTKAQGIIAQYRNRMLLAAFAVTFVQKALVSFVKQSGIQESAVRKVAAVFGGEASKSLSEYAAKIQSVTMYGDEVILNVMAQIGAFGASEKATKELTLATVDLAAGLGIDLNTAGLLIAKTYGSTTNALIRYGVAVDGTASKSEKQKAIIDAINVKWRGLASSSIKCLGRFYRESRKGFNSRSISRG